MNETFGSYCMINDVDCTSNHVKLKTTSLVMILLLTETTIK